MGSVTVAVEVELVFEEVVVEVVAVDVVLEDAFDEVAVLVVLEDTALEISEVTALTGSAELFEMGFTTISTGLEVATCSNLSLLVFLFSKVGEIAE